jgi:hypothetical protein
MQGQSAYHDDVPAVSSNDFHSLVYAAR